MRGGWRTGDFTTLGYASAFYELEHERMAAIRQLISLLLICAMTFTAVPAVANPPKITSADAVKAKVRKLGVGEHVMVMRTERPKLRGHITAIEEQSFLLRPDKSQAEVAIPYSDVLKIKKNPGPVMWMLVGAALVIIVLVAV